MKLMSFWSKFLIALAVTIFVTTGAVAGVLAGQKEEFDMGGTIKYSVPSFTVEFLNYDDTVFEKQTVSYGQDATRPTQNPTRDGYTFKDWTDFTNITSDRRVASTWTKNESYLRNDWQSLLSSAIGSNSNIKRILFTDDSTKIPEGVSPISVGATNATSNTAWIDGCGCFDVSAYVSPNSTDSSKYDIVFYCPHTIFAPEDSSYLFCLENLTLIDLSSNFNTSKVTNMQCMFKGCYSLSSVDIINFDTSNVTYMDGMFAYCELLSNLNLSSFNTTNVTDMFAMFDSCEQLVTLNLSNFNTANVTNMGDMFSGCFNLESVDVSSFDTSNVTNMSNMFYGCESLEAINLSSFDTSNVTDMSVMFMGCSALESLNLSNFDTSMVTEMSEMFEGCSGLTSLDVSNFNTSKVIYMDCMFWYCSKLTSLDLSSFDMSLVTATTDMFTNCSALIELKTPKAIGAKTASLPSANWYDEEMNGAYSVISSDMLSSGSITLRPAYTIDLRAESPYWGPSTDEYKYFSYDGENFAGASSLYGDDIAYVNQDFSTTIAKNANKIQLLPKDSSVWESVEGLGINQTNGLRTTIYIWGNAQYSIRVPEGYFLEISEFDYEGNVLSVLEYGNEYVNDSTQNDYYETITTSPRAYKLELALWHCTKNITASKVLTSDLSNLYIILAQSKIVNMYLGHPIPMPKVYVQGLDFSNYILDSDFQTTSTINGVLHADFNGGGYAMDAGAIIHYEVMNPTIYTLSIDSGNGMYDGKTGTNVIGSGYAGQTLTIYKSLVTVPETWYFKELKKVDGSKGTLQGQIGTVSSESETATYQLGAGNATVKLNVVKNSASYLRKDWKAALQNANLTGAGKYIKTLEFTKKIPTNVADAVGSTSVGASTADGTTAWDISATGVNDITAYVILNSTDENGHNYYDVYIYSPITIYAPINSTQLLSCGMVEKISFYNFNTSKVTNMWSMFEGNWYLKEIVGLNKFNTKKVTNMNLMFGECWELESLDVSTFNTSKVTDMYGMFKECSAAPITGLEKFDTSNVIDMDDMFNNCSVTSLDLSSFDTSKVTDMSGMFYYCSGLTSLDLSSFDMSNVTNTNFMLSDCTALTEITTPTTMGSVVAGLPNENVGYIWVDKNNQSQSYAQIDSTCTGKTLILIAAPAYLRRDWQTALIAADSSYDGSNIKTIEFTNVMPTSYNNEVSVGAADSTGETAWVPGGAAVGDITAYIKTNSSDSTKYDIIFYAPGTIYAPVDSYALFNDVTEDDDRYTLDNLISIKFNNFDTSNVENMNDMFLNCSSLTTLDVSSFDTSKVEYMNDMFFGCSSLKSLNLSNFDTSKVTSMWNMFYNCSELTSLDLSSFDTSKVEYMNEMFYGCIKLTSLDLSNFDTSKVTDMYRMFYGCSKLTSLDLSNFDMSLVTYTTSMLADCSSLTTIKTPKAIGSTQVELPETTDKYWFENGTINAYTELDSTNTNKTLILHSAYAILYKDYISAIATVIKGRNSFSTGSLTSIVFTNTEPDNSDSTYTTISVGATDFAGETLYSTATGIEDITAYITYTVQSIPNKRGFCYLNTIIFYSPVTMYIPTDASSLFNYSSLTELDFSCASFEFTTTATDTITSCTKLTEIKRPVAVGSANIVLPVIEGYQWQTRYKNGSLFRTVVYENLPAIAKTKYGSLKTIDLVGKSYTVSLDGNGGTGGSSSISATYDSAMPTIGSSNLPTRDGYDFVGYATSTTTLAISNIETDYENYCLRVRFNPSDLAVGDKVAIVLRYKNSSCDTFAFNFNEITTSNYTSKEDKNGYRYLVVYHTITSSDLGTNNGVDYSQSRYFEVGEIYDTTEITVLAAIKGYFYYFPDGTSAKDYDIASDTTLYAIWGNNYTATFRDDILANTWNDVSADYTSRFTNWQVSGNTLSVSTYGGGGWEARYIPVNVVAGIKYTWSFRYTMPTLTAQYCTSVSAGRMRAQILTKAEDGDNLVNQINTTSGSGYYEMLSATTGSANLTFTPTSSGTYYLCLNFGYCNDETALSFTFSDMQFYATKNVNYGSSYGTLPTPPTRDGYTFEGWSSSNSVFDFKNWFAYYDSSCNEGTASFDRIAGTITLNATGSDCYTTPWNGFRSDIGSYATVSPNTSYVFSWKQSSQTSAVNNYIFFFDSPSATSYVNAALSEEYDSATGRYYISFTTPSTTTCLRFRFGLASAAGTTLIISDIKLEVGSTPTNDTIVSSTSTVQTASNHTLYAKWKPNAYLRRDWLSAITAKNSSYTGPKIKTIQFVNTIPTGTGYTTVSVGATTSAGTTAWTANCGVYDITAYIKANSSDSTKYDIIFYSPAIIYAPTISQYLFSSSNSSNKLTNLTSISFDNFDTSNVTNMSFMFYDCSSLTSLDVTNFNTSNVAIMYCMFSNCSNLTSLDLRAFNTSNVTSMYQMFLNCSSLTSLNLSSFNTSNVTAMFNMFYGCSGLTSLDLSNFDTSKVTNMSLMFSGCSRLTSLNLSSFDMSKVSITNDMLSGCSSLTTIKTPKAIGSATVNLPTKSGYSWKDSDGNVYTTISSSNLNKTLTLVAG